MKVHRRRIGWALLIIGILLLIFSMLSSGSPQFTHGDLISIVIVVVGLLLIFWEAEKKE